MPRSGIPAVFGADSFHNRLQAFGVNSLNELTCETDSGTLTVAGATTAIATNVTVSGAGLTNALAEFYQDASWAVDGATMVTNGTLTAVATDSYGRTASTSIPIGY